MSSTPLLPTMIGPYKFKTQSGADAEINIVNLAAVSPTGKHSNIYMGTLTTPGSDPVTVEWNDIGVCPGMPEGNIQPKGDEWTKLTKEAEQIINI